MSDMDFVTRAGFDLLESKIEELRKDKNFEVDCINNRISSIIHHQDRIIKSLVERIEEIERKLFMEK